MTSRKELVLEAVRKALRVRKTAGIGSAESICAFDLAEKLGVEVRFDALPSMEGMYCRLPRPLIAISSFRPPGRQSYTCAHELGHHVFAHGMRVDEYIKGGVRDMNSDPDEFLAECFAGGLLMPSTAVSHEFAIRGWDVDRCTPEQVYTIAGSFGVGYTTLVSHMCYTLKLITRSHASQLERISRKHIKARLIGREIAENVLIVDACWTGRAVDISVGDYIMLPPGIMIDGRCIVECSASVPSVVQGCRPGIGRVHVPNTDWAAFVRVSRREYTGRSVFRHLEDPDHE